MKFTFQKYIYVTSLVLIKPLYRRNLQWKRQKLTQNHLAASQPAVICFCRIWLWMLRSHRERWGPKPRRRVVSSVVDSAWNHDAGHISAAQYKARQVPWPEGTASTLSSMSYLAENGKKSATSWQQDSSLCEAKGHNADPDIWKCSAKPTLINF